MYPPTRTLSYKLSKDKGKQKLGKLCDRIWYTYDYKENSG